MVAVATTVLKNLSDLAPIWCNCLHKQQEAQGYGYVGGTLGWAGLMCSMLLLACISGQQTCVVPQNSVLLGSHGTAGVKAQLMHNALLTVNALLLCCLCADVHCLICGHGCTFPA